MSVIKEHYYDDIEAATRQKEYPILFNNEMVQAILTDQKNANPTGYKSTTRD